MYANLPRPLTRDARYTTESLVRFEPLGDQAVMAYCDDETHAIRVARRVRAAAPSWLVDVVQAYVSVAIYYQQADVDCFQVADWLATLSTDKMTETPSDVRRLHVIPCCYDLGFDLDRVANHTGLDRAAIIGLHSSTTYTVYAIGFCPGFPYLGYLPDELAGVPRLESPRLRVDAGCVGLTGRQTGIYTEARPGGWNIIGRTPLQLVDVKAGYFPLRTGDEVRFRKIDDAEYRRMLGMRLS